MVVAEREERIVPLQSGSKTINKLLRHPFVRDIYEILNRILAISGMDSRFQELPIVLLAYTVGYNNSTVIICYEAYIYSQL